jgi:CHASE2 domain-containing sensor protein/signal transduction histidine kinase
MTSAPVQAGPKRPSAQARRREWWLVSLSLMGLTAVACWGHWTWHLDQAVYDAAQSTWTRAVPQDVVVVAIDDASLQAVGRWPWKRAIHAQVLDQVRQAGAKAVLLDLLMSEPDADPLQDEVLAKALGPDQKVILPVSHALDGLGQGQELPPVAPLRRRARLAHADVAIDVDGTVRWAYLWAGSGAHRYPHPALALMQAAGERTADLVQPPDATALPTSAYWHRDGPTAIRYLGPPGRVLHVSYAAVLRGEVPASTFTGRYVLIGVTAHGLGESFQTPVSQMGEGMSGVEVVAQLLDALRQRKLITVVPPPVNAALSAMAVMGLLWLFRRQTPRQALLTAMGMAVGAVLLGWSLLSWGLWWPPFGLVMGALLSYPVWSWRRLEGTARDLELELQALSGEPGVQASSLLAPGNRSGDFMSQRTDAISLATTQLQQARQLLAHTLASMPDALFVVDQHHLITQANQQACSMSGVSHIQALLGRRLDDVLAPLTPVEAPTWGMLLDKARHSRQALSTEATHPRGMQYLVGMVSLDDALPEAGAIVCATDVTALRQAELQRTELLGFIAHDIRSPQASLISLVQLHQMGGQMSQAETLDHVESLARQTLDLCEELLQVMRAETRAISLAPQDLVKLLQGCMDEIKPQALAKGLSLSGNWPAEHAQPCVVDDYLVHRAIINLLSNAIKFSPKGGRVTVSITRSPSHHVIAVRDQGPGIPEAELGRLFKRYERVEQGRPSKLAAGIGLGLVFIDTVARRHGGDVRIHNTPGEGACFELWLPVDASH